MAGPQLPKLPETSAHRPTDDPSDGELMNRKVLGVCMLLGVAVSIDTAVAHTIHPQWSVANGSIILYNRDGSAADLFILEPDSGEMQVLLSDGNYNANPSWSPDAKKVSFTSARPDMNGTWQLYVLDLETLVSTAYTNDVSRKMHTAWSPDGRWISFVRMREGKSDVFIISADGRTERQLTFTAENEFHPKWTADSSRVIFDGGAEDARQICSVDRHGGEMTCIEPLDGWRVSAPSVSPDDQVIAFACQDAEGGNICQMSFDGSNQRMLVDLPTGISGGGPVFSPDGKRLAFHRSTDDGYKIVIVSPQ